MKSQTLHINICIIEPFNANEMVLLTGGLSVNQAMRTLSIHGVCRQINQENCNCNESCGGNGHGNSSTGGGDGYSGGGYGGGTR